VILPSLKKALIVLLILVGLPTGGLVAWAMWGEYRDRRVAETCRIAEKSIVAALFNYHSDNGRYPTDLSELQPKYLKDIPTPTTGDRKWLYWPNGSQEFRLGFQDAQDERHPSAYFDSKNRSWWIDTK
jgi:hypothetical protein